MIVTIDGPAGAGKSTVTRLLAEQLGFQFLDTGAMYRAVTWAAIDRGVDLRDEGALLELAQNLEISFDGELVVVDGRNVTRDIRTQEITRNIVFAADNVGVRNHLVSLQRQIAETGNFVCEGRDQGTVAFPDAGCKIYLTASSHDRALRRIAQMEQLGAAVNYDSIVQEQERRDQEDLSRPVGRLRKAKDAIEFNTDGKSIEEVVSSLLAIIRDRLGLLPT
jgi:CMP/dCMP kinase